MLKLFEDGEEGRRVVAANLDFLLGKFFYYTMGEEKHRLRKNSGKLLQLLKFCTLVKGTPSAISLEDLFSPF